MRRNHIGRIVAIGGGDLQSNHPINKYMVEMDKKNSHNLLFVGTASAGAMCWFDCGHSNSKVFWVNETVGYGWVEQLLNMHPYVYCPHYEECVESFDKMIMEKAISGLAMESDTAFVEANGND